MKCLDTYALIEIHDENPNFLQYKEQEFIIPDLIIAEFYSIILRDYNEKTADYLLKKFETHITSVNFNTIIKAVKFRHDNKKKNFSFFDCVGYIFAVENKMKFVTGEKEFKNLPHVEFVK